MTSNIELERISLQDLKKLVEEAKEWDLKLVLIGGYAVRAYTKPRRFTKDLDFVTIREGLGQMKGFLHYMNYEYKSGEFWLSGSKKLNETWIDLHMSIDKVHDITTGYDYPVTPDFFQNLQKRKITTYFEENSHMSLQAQISPIEDLLIMKLIPLRDKDLIDVIALILDSYDQINPSRFYQSIHKANLRSHINSRLTTLFLQIKRKERINQTWRNITGTEYRISHSEIASLKKRIKKLMETIAK
ncbi:MAG: DUF6036 family nucleotidyltransferase [Thermoproteota archaeon]|nr:DUF6036 family nucleotidyltransferase [Thermoproteota archaeon]